MKKIVALVLAIIAVMSFSACGKKKTEDVEKTTEAETMVEEKDEAEEKDEVDDNAGRPDIDGDEVTEETKEEVGEEVGEEAESTVGNTLLAIFNDKAKDDMSAEELANEVVLNGELPFMPMVMGVEEGYLAGFDEEINGFTSAATFAPMIGSIPFVGYVFETEDADTLISEIEKNANLRWNICVEAEEMVVGKMGNKVFFVMCPKSMAE